MNRKRTSEPARHDDVPYDKQDRKAVLAFWDSAEQHTGLDELKKKRGRPRKADNARKEQIALRIDADVLAWFRTQGEGWQTRMNAVLRAYRDARLSPQTPLPATRRQVPE